MKKNSIISTVATFLTSLSSTTNAFTTGPSLIARCHVRTPTELYSMDTSRMSLDELKKIAKNKGYDTVGMDRTGLEMIARGWTGTVKTRAQLADADVVDVTDIVFTKGEYSKEYEGEGKPFGKKKANNSGQVKGKAWQVRKTNTPKNSPKQQPKQLPKQASKGATMFNQAASKPNLTDKSNNYEEYGSGGGGSNPPSWVDTQSRPISQQQPLSGQTYSANSQQNGSGQAYSGNSQQKASGMPYSVKPQNDRNDFNTNQSNSNRNIEVNPTSTFKDSVKSAFVGFLAGGVAVSPITYLHNIQIPSEIITNEMSQFQFDTLSGSISGAAFAMLYRYFIKEEKEELIANGAVGAFVVAKSFSRIRVSYYCDNLYCGEPLGIMDWDMLQQLGLSSLENLALFGAVALVMEYFCDKGFISTNE